MILTLQVEFNFKVKIYPILSLWVCPRHKSPPIEVRISIFEPKMHVSTVKVPIDFGIDWPWSFSFIFNLKPVFCQTFGLLFILRLFVYI